MMLSQSLAGSGLRHESGVVKKVCATSQTQIKIKKIIASAQPDEADEMVD